MTLVAHLMASPNRAKLRRALVLLAAFALVAAMATDMLACPMCKAALGSQGRDHGDWVGGFFWSILFMLSMPFLIFTSLAAYMYVLVRRARRQPTSQARPANVAPAAARERRELLTVAALEPAGGVDRDRDGRE